MDVLAADAYTARLAARRATVERLDRIDARVAYLRLATFVAGALVFVLMWRNVTLAWTLLAPLVAFIALVIVHDRVFRRRTAAQRAIVFYERGLARLGDAWIGTGEPGDRFVDDEHLYANDLDLFGRGSLFELLSTARTRAGEATLAGWLKAPGSLTEIAGRHAAIRELRPLLDLRESLSLAGADVRAGVDGDALVAWAGSPSVLGASWWRTIAVLQTVVTVGALLWVWMASDLVPLELALVLQGLVGWARRHAIEKTLHAAGKPARDLDVLSHLLETLERQTFSAPRLRELRGRLDTDDRKASAAILTLHRLIELHDWQHNVFFGPIAAVFQWGTHLAWAIDTWRETHGVHIARWLDAVAEIEALASLTTYHDEHPDDPFPDMVDAAGAVFDGEGLGHLLIPAARMVRNDARFTGESRLLVVSGSNMSGKSTYLRTVGINAVLALAGAPVRARSLRLTPLALGATLRIQDSLQEGRSRFYAEISRIRRLADLAGGPLPLLFLLDELFHGTNSHDRVVGASGVLRSLVDRGAIGLVTTHDLAMTRVIDDLAPRAVNVHFEDWFEAGELQFDYRVKPGPVTRSNAIALMRAVGLDVDESES